MQGFKVSLMQRNPNFGIKINKVNEIWVKGTGLRSMHEGYVKDSYYARFHTHSYHLCRENQTST